MSLRNEKEGPSQLSSSSATQRCTLSYSDIAAKLIADRLILTALELHSELLEAGKELKLLRDYFSNPINFEGQPQDAPLISRCSSQVTLDSLDLTRFSEDGEKCGDERVAVLEFELRKARETINALRNNLTVAIESETIVSCSPDNKKLHNDSIKPHEQRALNYLINEYLLLHNYKLTSITFSDENENQDFEDWDDVGLNIAKPAELLTLFRDGIKQSKCDNKVNASTQSDLISSIDDDQESVNDAINLKEAEQRIEELGKQLSHLQDENMKLAERNVRIDEQLRQLEPKMANKEECRVDALSRISLDENDEWTNITLKPNVNVEENTIAAYFNCSTNHMNPHYKQHLLNACLADVLSNRIDFSAYLYNESLIATLTSSLIKAVPSIILNKREDIIPLLVKTIILNNDGVEREKLLSLLFNLKKKPTKEERQIILAGITSIAQCLGETIVENEILTHCWEQLTHKHIEKRFLVIEACIVLLPHISSSIRNSLILSMLQQMMDDREEQVRAMVYRAFALIVSLCDDVNKYVQCEALALRSLTDPSLIVFDVCVQILFPVVAKWALNIGRFESDLIKCLLFELNSHLKESNNCTETSDSLQVLRIVKVLDALLPFLVFYVANVDAIVGNIAKEMTIELRSDFAQLCSPLTNPCNVFVTSDYSVAMVFYEFEQYNWENESSFTRWPELDWLLDIVIPDLLNNLNHIPIVQSNRTLLPTIIHLFKHISILFGKTFTVAHIRPLFQLQIDNLEQILASCNHQYTLTLAIIPVYLVSILTNCNGMEELARNLTRFLCALPLCGAPIDCLQLAVGQLCELGLAETVSGCLWEGVVHPRPLVRAATSTLLQSVIGQCETALLSAKITPAIVTLANDSDVLVKTATIPTLAALITDCASSDIHEKAYIQLQTCLSDPVAKENHTYFRQLVVTLGVIAVLCKPSYREDVIIPKLLSACLDTAQMANSTRKIDMTLALLETFSKIVYNSSISKHSINGSLLPALRCVETIISDNPTLTSHQSSIVSMIKEAETRIHSTLAPATGANNAFANHGIDDMRHRVTKIFSKTPTAKSTLQSMFNKK